MLRNYLRENSKCPIGGVTKCYNSALIFLLVLSLVLSSGSSVSSKVFLSINVGFRFICFFWCGSFSLSTRLENEDPLRRYSSRVRLLDVRHISQAESAYSRQTRIRCVLKWISWIFINFHYSLGGYGGGYEEGLGYGGGFESQHNYLEPEIHTSVIHTPVIHKTIKVLEPVHVVKKVYAAPVYGYGHGYGGGHGLTTTSHASSYAYAHATATAGSHGAGYGQWK